MHFFDLPCFFQNHMLHIFTKRQNKCSRHGKFTTLATWFNSWQLWIFTTRSFGSTYSGSTLFHIISFKPGSLYSPKLSRGKWCFLLINNSSRIELRCEISKLSNFEFMCGLPITSCDSSQRQVNPSIPCILRVLTGMPDRRTSFWSSGTVDTFIPRPFKRSSRQSKLSITELCEMSTFLMNKSITNKLTRFGRWVLQRYQYPKQASISSLWDFLAPQERKRCMYSRWVLQDLHIVINLHDMPQVLEHIIPQ